MTLGELMHLSQLSILHKRFLLAEQKENANDTDHHGLQLKHAVA